MHVREIRATIAGLEPSAARAELSRRLDDLYQELFNLRFQWETRQLKNSNRMTKVRHDIARFKTVMREKELEVEKGE
jgi:large subunit ribosomal protein L29